MDPVPFELDGFEPVRPLGGGGFGEVWLARQTNIDRDVAIKVGHAPIDDKTVQMRFERECIALGRLSGHPNIIDVFTAGQLKDGRPYLVLEYISGGTLWQRAKQNPVAEDDLRRIGAQLADALTTAHASGVLHRDLKPENVLLRPSGEAVLGDFGIARLHDGANTTSQAITASVAYAAPEILSGQPASVVSDLYGIGICLLAAVLRSVPFVNNTDESIHPIINRVLTDQPPDLRDHGLSDELAGLIARLLDKDPTKRPQTAAELKQLLESPVSGGERPRTAAGVSPEPANETRLLSTFPPPGSPASSSRSDDTPRVFGGPLAGPSGPGRTDFGAPTPGTPRYPTDPRSLPAPPAAHASGPGPYSGPGPNSGPGPYSGPGPNSGPGPYGGPGPNSGPGPYGGPGPNSGPGPYGGPQGGPGTDSGSAYRPLSHAAASPSPYQPQTLGSPAPVQGSGAGGRGGGANRWLVFAAGFGVTVLLGGLLLWALLGGDGPEDDRVETDDNALDGTSGDGITSDDTTSDDTTSDDTTSNDAGSGDSASGDTDSGADDTGDDAEAEELPELVLPITLADLDYGDNATTDPDFIGPASQQFCGNFPVTDGLVDWVGETVSGSTGIPVFFQELVRFETEDDASAYVASMAATVDCDEWTVPGVEGGPDVVLNPEVVTPTTELGDETMAIDFGGGAEGVTVSARAVLIRGGVDVFVASATGLQPADADAVDDLSELAAERLGF